METYNDHLKFGYKEKNGHFRNDENDHWFVQYGEIKNIPMSFGEEAIRAAQLIRSVYPNKELILFYSGGADSEFMLRSFIRAEVTFTTAIIRFNDDLNHHDIVFAENFCKKNNIKPLYIDIDIYHFFHSGLAEEYARISQTTTPALLHHLWAIDQVLGVPILATGENYWYKSRYNEIAPWEFWDEEIFFGVHRFLRERKRSAVPAFYKFTPEFVLSGILLPRVQSLINNQYDVRWFDSEKIKLLCYKDIYADIPDLPVPGYTGFERVFMLFAEYMYRLKEERGVSIQKLSLNEILIQLGFFKFNKDNEELLKEYWEKYI